MGGKTGNRQGRRRGGIGARKGAREDLSAREKILRAAEALFGGVGYAAASTREIAERSGVNKALIHYHFRSKQALFAEVLERYYDELERVLRSALSGPGGLRERLERVLSAYVVFLARHQNFMRMVQREAAGGAHLPRIVARMVPLFQTGVATIQEGYPASRSGALSAPQLLTSFYGMIVAYFTYSPVLRQLLGEDPFSPSRLAAFQRHLFRLLGLVTRELEQEGAAKRGGPRRRRPPWRKP